MLLKRSAIVLVLFVLLAGLLVASASAANPLSLKKARNSSYSVSPGTGSDPGIIVPMSTSSFIRQYETKWHTRYISGHPYSFNVDLYWGDPASSLRIRIYTPDGAVLGPFYDNFDGNYNGDIPIQVYRQGGVAEGTYYFEVYGQSIPYGYQWYSMN